MAASADVNRWVFLLKGDGFWHTETEQVLRFAVQNLTDRGFSSEEARELIGEVWAAAAGEYGE